MRLDDKGIRGLKLHEGESERIIFDDKLAGFGVRLRAGGKRTWIVQYRVCLLYTSDAADE